MSVDPHRFTIRVYYEDTDFSGVVYHANYLRYLERGRTEMLRDPGDRPGGTLCRRWRGTASASRSLPWRSRSAGLPAWTMSWRSKPKSYRSVGRRCGCGQRLLRDAELLVEAAVRIATLSRGRAARLPPGIAAKLKA